MCQVFPISMRMTLLSPCVPASMSDPMAMCRCAPRRGTPVAAPPPAWCTLGDTRERQGERDPESCGMRQTLSCAHTTSDAALPLVYTT